MGIAGLEIYYEEEDGEKRLGVKVCDRDATLADLLEVWQPLCDDPGLYKAYADSPRSVCKGCKINCCNTAYVIPDFISFKLIAAYFNMDYSTFIKENFQTDKVRQGLLCLRTDPCIFLKDRICTIYPLRSLLCRFYLCTPMQADTEQLIYSITWTGITATQIFAEKKGLIDKREPSGLTSFDMMCQNLLEGYRSDPNVNLFLMAEDYADIPLRPFLPED